MATYKTEAIVLSSYPYREHDRIISLFSDAFGKIEARARGVRKIESKLAGHLEPFIKTELLLANGRKWDILAGSRTHNPRALIRSNINKTAAASVCVEAVKKATRPNSLERGMYAMLDQTLGALEQSQGNEADISGQFVWRLMAAAGFSPELGRCIHCKRAVLEGSFSCEGGGVLCNTCSERDIYADQAPASVLAELRETEYSFGAQAQIIAKRFWNYVFDAPIESWNFLDGLHTVTEHYGSTTQHHKRHEEHLWHRQF
ncbi:MAG: DNA repair protein RecO [Patescibacteria group bacterium]|nr:DNA repair protein RecO [Patescibacteria group bacterium]